MRVLTFLPALALTFVGCTSSKGLSIDKEELASADVIASFDEEWVMTLRTGDSIRFHQKVRKTLAMDWKTPQVIGESRVFRGEINGEIFSLILNPDTCGPMGNTLAVTVEINFRDTVYSGCGNFSPEVLGYHDIWVVDSILGQPYTDYEEGNVGRPYIEFQPRYGMAMGLSGCNSWHGNVWVGKDRLVHLSSMVVTEMYCEGSSEEAFFKAWNGADRIIRNGNKLVLMDGSARSMVLHKGD